MEMGEDRSNTIDEIYRIANQEIAEERKSKSWLYKGKDKEIIPLSEFYEKQKWELIIDIINGAKGIPLCSCKHYLKAFLFAPVNKINAAG